MLIKDMLADLFGAKTDDYHNGKVFANFNYLGKKYHVDYCDGHYKAGKLSENKADEFDLNHFTEDDEKEVQDLISLIKHAYIYGLIADKYLEVKERHAEYMEIYMNAVMTEKNSGQRYVDHVLTFQTYKNGDIFKAQVLEKSSMDLSFADKLSKAYEKFDEIQKNFHKYFNGDLFNTVNSLIVPADTFNSYVDQLINKVVEKFNIPKVDQNIPDNYVRTIHGEGFNILYGVSNCKITKIEIRRSGNERLDLSHFHTKCIYGKGKLLTSLHVSSGTLSDKAAENFEKIEKYIDDMPM